MKRTRATYQWVPESIRIYKPLYKGRRYWVFLNDQERPFEEWTKDFEVIAYDIDFSGVLAVGNYNEKRRIDGCYLGGQGMTFEANEPKDMITQCQRIMKWYY